MQNKKEYLAQEQLKSFSSTSIVTQISNTLLAWLSFFFLKNETNEFAITIWIVAFSVFFGLRMFFLMKLKKTTKSHNVLKILNIFRIFIVINALIWTSACFIIYPSASVSEIYVFNFIITNIIAGSIILYSIDSISSIIYPPVALIALAFMFITKDISNGYFIFSSAFIMIIFLMINIRKITKEREEFIVSKQEIELKKEELFIKEQRTNVILNQNSFAIVHFDKDLNIIYSNNFFNILFNISENDKISLNLISDLFLKPATSALGGTQNEICCSINDNKTFLHCSFAPILNSDRIIGGIGIINDITDNKLNEIQIQKLQNFDPLTTLANKKTFLSKAELALKRSLEDNTISVVLLMDINDFKIINDTFGHNKGDEYLKEIAHRLKQNCDNFLVARIGGDEFAVLLNNIAQNDDEAKQKAYDLSIKLIENISKPYIINNSSQSVNISIGISISNAYKQSQDMLKQAEIAMYKAKQNKEQVCFFTHSMQFEMTNSLKLENELKNAIKNEEFILHFQPQVRHDGTIYGVESLIRWHHPQKGLIYPDKFIDFAEERKLIFDIGLIIIKKAFSQMAAWKDDEILGKITVSINISAAQFAIENFASIVLDMIKKYDIDPRLVVFEFTESTLVYCNEETIKKMKMLKRHGIKFSIDDFGIGYSCFMYIHKLPINEIKIDRVFVNNIYNTESGFSIIYAMITIANGLNFNIIAEGVEDTKQRDLLYKMGCKNFQGYLYSRPISCYELEKIVHQNGGKIG